MPSYIFGMCGRITQKSNPNRLGLGLVTVNLIEPLQLPPCYNGAPGKTIG